MSQKLTWPTIWKTPLVLLLALSLARFGMVGLPKVLSNTISSDGDESAYLALGLALPESGVLSDGTRPPLYALLLSPWAEREWAYFTTAKLVTLAVGGLTALVTFLVGVRLFGWETALLAAFLLSINKEFHVRASTVYADTLLALVLLGAWYFLIKSLEGWKYGILAGFFVGMAFLTKGSAPVLLAAWGLTALLVLRHKIFRRPDLLLVPLFFVIVSLPLLIYNAREFGSPGYNFATQHIMWMDRLAEIDTADPADLPTFSTYLATHGPADVLDRLERGQRRLNPVVARSLNPNRTFEPAWLGPALGLLAVVLLVYLLLFQRAALARYLAQHQAVLWFTLWLNGLFYLFFVWYVAGSSAETRFIVPLLAPIYLVLADAAVSLASGLGRRLGALAEETAPGPARRGPLAGLYWLAIALVVAWGGWSLVDTSRREAWALSIDPYEADLSANSEVEEVVRWLVADRPSGEALVLFGPSKSLPLWKFPARFGVERLPVEIDTWPAMQAYLAGVQPDYIIIDHDTARRRRGALSGYFQGLENEQVQFERIPPGWGLNLVYPDWPCKWCIFSPATPGPAVARLENGPELLSSRLADGEIEPPGAASPAAAPTAQAAAAGQGLRLILSWTSRAEMSEDYTVFVHLAAPDGFVKAQADRPPFGGAYPTSRWQPGEVLADRYELVLDNSLPPGDYLLLAGMYRPATGDRLNLLSGPAGPVPGSILLGTIRIE